MIAQANINTFGKYLSASLLPCKPSLSDHNAKWFCEITYRYSNINCTPMNMQQLAAIRKRNPNGETERVMTW
jgi:hypothetical protein